MAATEEQQPPSVDDSPISPSRPNTQRKNSLEKHLMHRPERQELIDSMFRPGQPCQNILPASHAAPGLQEKQKELEKHMRADSLNDKISHRPSPDKLIQEGVLRDDPRSPEDKYLEAMEDEYAKREGGA